MYRSRSLKFRDGLLCASASLALMGALAAPGAASAQTASPPTPPGGQGTAQLDTIVVTARRSEERAQDIPVAVTALSAKTLTLNQIRDLGDVANYTPGLRFTDFLDSFNGNVTIRGLQQTNVQNAIGNVGTFIDGIYLQRGYMVDASLGDYQRIEVEKGPQTALYGQNTFAGAVNFVTKEPRDEYNADATVSVGSAGLRSTQIGVGGPIIRGILDTRLYYGQADYDGSWRNNTPGVTGEASHFGAYNRRNFSGALKFTPTDRITISTNFYSMRKQEEIRPFYTIDGNSPEDFLNCGSMWCGSLPTNPAAVRTGVGNPPTGLFTEQQPDTNVYTRVWRVAAAYKVTDDLTLNYLYGNVRGSAVEQSSFAANAYNPTGASTISAQREAGLLTAQTHEVRLVYAPKSGLKGEVGYFHSETSDFFLFGLNFGITPGQPIPSFGSSPTCLTCVQDIFTEQLTNYTINSWFGRLSYSMLDDRATAGVELRYIDTKVVENDLLTRSKNPSLPLLSSDYGDIVPRVTLNYKVTPDNMIYLSVAEGVKAGGFNGYSSGAVTLLPSEQAFGEESNWTYEIGWKGSLFDHRLTFAADAFYVDWRNRQISVQPANYVPTTNSQETAVPVIYQASGDATDYGVEVNGDYRPIRPLTFTYSLSLQNPTDSKGSRVPNAALYCTGACPANGDVSGNVIGNVPRVSAAIGAEYRHDLSVLPTWMAPTDPDDIYVFAGVNGTYRGTVYTDDLNVTKIDPYWLADAHLGLAKGNIEAFIWVKNMFDKVYVESSFVVPSIKQYNVDFGERRTVGITLSASY